MTFNHDSTGDRPWRRSRSISFSGSPAFAVISRASTIFVPSPRHPAVGAGYLVRVLAITAAIFAALSLAVWGTVWIAIQLL